MGKITILDETTKNPITFIGKMAGLCYGSNTLDDEKNYKRGLDCIKSGHDRALEFPDIYLFIDGYSARTIRQLYTHVGGLPTRLQSSTRYIDYSNFEYIIPPTLRRNSEALEEYEEALEKSSYYISRLINKYEIPKEDAALLLPLGMTTTMSGKYNARELVSIYEQRSCLRAYWEIRDLIEDWILALQDYSSEWETFCSLKMKCKCDKVGFCIEKFGCGKYPKKELS